jgi:hypothetical protein
MSDDRAVDAPRYSDAAGVENHPQITDFVPRRFSTIAMLVMLGACATATLAALNYFVAPLAQANGITSTVAFDLAASGSVGGWLSAVVLLLSSGLCLLTYSIRRHRIDDIRGRYRVWLGASIACLVLSANSVSGMHQLAADALAHFSGWTALRGGAVWWLLLAGVPIGWIALRAALDMLECRLATLLFSLTLVCFGTSAAAFLGFLPRLEARLEALLTSATVLLGNWLLFASFVAYSRFVVLDAQGLITVARPARKRAAKTEPAKRAVETKPETAKPATVLSAGGYSRATLQPAKTPAEPDRWLDGSRPEREHYDDDEDDDSSGDDRKLSKSDRKRLRKLKAQNRAA